MLAIAATRGLWPNQYEQLEEDSTRLAKAQLALFELQLGTHALASDMLRGQTEHIVPPEITLTTLGGSSFKSLAELCDLARRKSAAAVGVLYCEGFRLTKESMQDDVRRARELASSTEPGASSTRSGTLYAAANVVEQLADAEEVITRLRNLGNSALAAIPAIL